MYSLFFFFFSDLGSSFIGKWFVSVPMVPGGSCGILSLNMCQTLFTPLFVMNLEITVAQVGWADMFYPRASKYTQLSKNGIW